MFQHILNGRAGADLSASQYLWVYRDAGASDVLKLVASIKRTDVAGILYSNDQGNGGLCEFVTAGIARAKAGGAIQVGDPVGSDASGKTIKAINGATVLGEYLCREDGSFADAAANDEIMILVYGNKRQRLDMTATATINLASVADGANVTATATVTGAATGDSVLVTAPSLEAGLTVRGYVSAADTVTVVVTNASGGSVDAASQDFLIRVIPA